MGLGPLASLDAADGEEVGVHLHDLVRARDEAQVLLLGRHEGGVGHHVEHADVQRPDVLALGPVDGEHVVPVGPQRIEARQIGVGN